MFFKCSRVYSLCARTDVDLRSAVNGFVGFYGGRIFELLHKRGGGSASLTGSYVHSTSGGHTEWWTISLEVERHCNGDESGDALVSVRLRMENPDHSHAWKGSRQIDFDLFCLFIFLINDPGLFMHSLLVHVKYKNVFNLGVSPFLK